MLQAGQRGKGGHPSPPWERRPRLPALTTGTGTAGSPSLRPPLAARLAAHRPAGPAAPRGHRARAGPLPGAAAEPQEAEAHSAAPLAAPPGGSSLRAAATSPARPACPDAGRATRVLRAPRHACGRALPSRRRSRGTAPPGEPRGRRAPGEAERARRGASRRRDGEMEAAAPRGLKWLMVPQPPAPQPLGCCREGPRPCARR